MFVPFDLLPLKVREGLVEVTQKKTDPRVLAADTALSAGWFKYAVLIGALGVAAFCLNYLRDRSRSVEQYSPAYDQEAFLGLAVALTLGGAAAFAVGYRFRWPPPDFREGDYVFASGLLKLRQSGVQFTPIAELGRPTIVHVIRNGSYSRSRLELAPGFTVTFDGRQLVEQVCARILAAKAQFPALLAARDRAAIAAVDPFAECSLSGKWAWPEESSVGPLSHRRPGWTTVVQWVVPLVAGLGASLGLYAAMTLAYPGG